MFWKIYFWVYLVFSALGFIGILVLISQNSLFNLIVVIDIFLSIAFLWAMYAYVFNKRFFSCQFWKAIFVVVIIVLVESLFENFVFPKEFIFTHLSFLEGNPFATGTVSDLFTWLINLPAIYAVYRLGMPYSKKNRK